MIDIKHLRENPKLYRQNTLKKFKDSKIVDLVLKLDKEWRETKSKADQLRNERNKISEEINQAKKRGKSADDLIKKAKGIPGKIQKTEEEEKNLYGKLKIELCRIPNLMSSRVPLGKDDSENVEEKKFGKMDRKSFPVKSHVEIAENLGVVDNPVLTPKQNNLEQITNQLSNR